VMTFYFTADTHFGHESIMRHCSRNSATFFFGDCEKALISLFA
jgi:calcineurin-like phosphoesterase family protein